MFTLNCSLAVTVFVDFSSENYKLIEIILNSSRAFSRVASEEAQDQSVQGQPLKGVKERASARQHHPHTQHHPF